MKRNKGCWIGLTCFTTLLLSAAIGYCYTIITNAGAGGSISPAGNVDVAAGETQTFTITPDLGYEISDVATDSGSVGKVASYTFSDVAADNSITATFSECTNPYPVMLENDGSFYNTVMEAYGAAYSQGAATIMLRAGSFPDQALYFDQDASIELKGGYDCSFLNNYMMTYLTGSLTVAAGTVVPSNFTLSSAPYCLPGDLDNFPGNPEICDGLDNDCDGVADNGLTFDRDHDGYTATGSCEGSADDCDDNNPGVHPYGEIYGDGIDQDCDGADLLFPIETDCFYCHSVDWVNNRSHDKVAAPDATCVDCHAQTVAHILRGHYGQTVRIDYNNMTPGEIIGCTSCHDAHDESEYVIPGDFIVWAKVDPNFTRNYSNKTCDTCHENRAALHATETAHNNRLIDSSCAQCHTSDTSVLGQPGGGSLTSQADVDTLHRSDCNLCHNYSGTKVWTVAVKQTIEDGLNGVQVSCVNCHTVLHHNNNEVHYDSSVDTSQSSRQGCADCHHDYDNVNGTSVGLSTWQAILVEHDLDGTKDGSTNTCMNCHGYDGSASPPLAAVQGAINGGVPVTCAACHTDKVPDVGHGVPTSGKHPQHLAMANVSCSNCHNTGQIPCFKSGTDNGDGCIDLSETDVCAVCHQDGSGNPAPDDYKAGWADPGFHLSCTSCHAAPPATGVHLSHFNGTASDLAYGDLRITQDFSGGAVSATNMIGCGNCHPMALSFHGNGIWGDIELADSSAPAGSLKSLSPNGSFDGTAKTCSNVYCHSVNSWATDGPVPSPWPPLTVWDPATDPLPRPLPDNIITTRAYKTVTWNSGETLSCGGCHDFPPQTDAADNDGGAGDSHYWIDSYGYENLHVWNMGNFPPIGCRTCHYDTVREYDETQGQGWDVDPSTYRRYYNDVALYDKAKHVNGSVNVVFDSVNNFTYDNGVSTPVTYDLSVASFDQATKTCSNVGCHQQETEVIWGVPYRWYGPTEECNRCHGY